MLSTMRIVLIAFAVIAVSIGIPLGFLAVSANYNYCAGHQGQHPTTEHHSDGSPVIGPPISDPSAARLLVYCSGVWASDNGAGITAVGTLLLFLVTGILGWIAYRQFTTTRAQLRAYVGVTVESIVNPAPGLNTQAIFRMENFGDTPANGVRYLAGLAVLPHPLLKSQSDIFIPHPEQTPPNMTIHKGQRAPGEAFFAGNVFSAEDYTRATTAPDNRLYVAGIVEYTDVFGIPHKTRFAFFLEAADLESARASMPTGVNVDVPINVGRISWVMSGVHNDAT